MSADVLRRAATLMRERAEAATSPTTARGCWFAPDYFAQTFRLPPVETEHWARAGVHIASWHPTVALAVAAWLDGVRLNHQTAEDGVSIIFCSSISEQDAALAVARAYLSESE